MKGVVTSLVAVLCLLCACNSDSDEYFEYSERSEADLIVVFLPDTSEQAIHDFFLAVLKAQDGSGAHAPGVRAILRTEVAGRPAFAVSLHTRATSQQRSRLVERTRSSPAIEAALENTTPIAAARSLSEGQAATPVKNDRETL